MNYPDSTVQILGSGVSSGNVFHPYHYYELYNHISGIEFTLGLNPLNGYASLTARISGVENTAAGVVAEYPLFAITSGSYVILSGEYANSTKPGFITALDWNTFNDKQNLLNYTPVSGINGLTGLSITLTTSNIAEGSNLYYTDQRVLDLIAASGITGPQGPTGPQGLSGIQGLQGVSGVPGTIQTFMAPLVLNGLSVSGLFASANNSGFLSNSDWINFNNKSFYTALSGNLTSTTPGLTITGGTNAVNGTGTTINIQQATANQSGILASGDWSSFNAKINSGVNLGVGTGVFADFNGTNLRFKSLVSGVGINIVSDANTITISSTATGGADTTTASNLGTGSGLFAQEVGSDLQFKTLKSGMNVTFDVTANDITINANLPAGAGEANTASNVDAGASGIGLYASKVGFDLRFKELVPGYGIGLSDITSGVEIYSSLPIASGNTSGILSAADWTSFNDRVRKNLMTRYEVVPLAAATVTTLGGIAATVNATATQPAYAQKYGWSQNFATAATLGSFAGLAGGANMFARSSGIAGTGPFNQQGGFDAWFRISVPDTIYSGVTPMFSGTRIFIGLSDQAAINQTLNLDNIPGNYAGFQFCNASGITTGLPVPRKETNWTFVTKNNVTQTIITGLPFLPECVYDIHFETIAPNDNIAFEMWNITSGYYHSGWANTNLPLNNTAMRPFLGIASFAMAAKNLRYGTFLVESTR